MPVNRWRNETVAADEYVVLVEFRRSKGSDLEIAKGRHPDKPDAEALRRQLRDELQHACENGVAGHFHVKEVWL